MQNAVTAANILTVIMIVRLCAVYGRKPSKNQKDHREQLLANNKPVETMAGRRMVCHLPSLKLRWAHVCRSACDTY